MYGNPDQPPGMDGQTTGGGIPVIFKPPARKPLVTYVLIGVTIFFYLLQMLSQAIASGYDWPFILGGKINELILQGQVWRLITPALLHGSLLHIAFNMYALYSLGSSMERYYGHRRYLLLYIIGAFCGNALSFLLSPKASIGASTAVFALVAAEGVFILFDHSTESLSPPKSYRLLMKPDGEEIEVMGSLVWSSLDVHLGKGFCFVGFNERDRRRLRKTIRNYADK